MVLILKKCTGVVFD